MFIRTQKWDFLNSIYFCFVTLSTIGFGDFVPKNKNNQDIGLTEDQTELVRIKYMLTSQDNYHDQSCDYR